jgi:ankyrin repeat protein
VKENFRSDFRMTPIHACVLHLRDDHEDTDSNLLPILLGLVEEANNAPADQDWSLLFPTIGDQTPLFTEILEMFQERANWLRANDRADEKMFLDLHNLPDAHDWTPLHWAAYAGRFSELKMLLERGATTKKLTTSRRNVVHHAAESGNAQLLKHLLENQEPLHVSTMKLDQQDLWGETPLHIAATRSAECVSYLISEGATLDLVQAEGETALHFASQAADEELLPIAKLLTQDCKSLVKVKDHSGRPATFNLLRSRECIEFLLDCGAKVDIRDRKKRSLLHEACIKGYPDTLELLLTKCPRRLITRIDVDGSTPLDAAFTCCTEDSARCAELILRHEGVTIRPTVDKRGWTILHHAAKLGDLEVLKLILCTSRFSVDDLVGRCIDSMQKIVVEGRGKWEGGLKSLLGDFERQARRSSVMSDYVRNKPEFYGHFGAGMNRNK